MTYAITCQNPACQVVKAVRSPYEQRRRKFCSRRCLGAVLGAANLAKTDRRAAAFASGKARRATLAARLEGRTKMQIYRDAYRVGWKSGVRYARKWAA